MGNSLKNVSLSSFCEELESIEKTAINPFRFLGNAASKVKEVVSRPTSPTGFRSRVSKQIGEASHRMLHPVEGLQKGWREMSPRYSMPTAAKDVEALRKKSPHLFDHAEPLGLRESFSGGGVKGLAEELSRRGWTGQRLKYLPVGQKSIITGLAVPSALDVRDAYKRGPVGPTGEHGVAETGLGQLLGTGAFVAGSGLGLIPGLGMYTLAEKAGGGLGRVIDRLRSGANLGQAVSAPSPSEVEDTLTGVERYYGHGNA